MFVTICVFFYSSVSWILYVCLKISKLKYLQLSSSNNFWVSHKLDIWYYSVPFGRHLKKSTGSGFSEHALCLSVVTHRLGSCSHTSHWPLVSVSKQWLHVFLSVTLKEHYITFFDNLNKCPNFQFHYILYFTCKWQNFTWIWIRYKRKKKDNQWKNLHSSKSSHNWRVLK